MGKEEYSPFFKLKLTGNQNAEVLPTIVFKPKDKKIIKDHGITYLHCIANSRYYTVYYTIYNNNSII